jgi:hypothetical protein
MKTISLNSIILCYILFVLSLSIIGHANAEDKVVLSNEKNDSFCSIIQSSEMNNSNQSSDVLPNNSIIIIHLNQTSNFYEENQLKNTPHPILIIQRNDINPKNLNEDSGNNIIISSILGGILALLGAIIVSHYNSKKEVLRLEYNWKKHFFEKYEQNYHIFINSISGLTSSDEIQKHYQKLNSDALIPEHVQKNILKNLDDLKSAKTVEERIKIRNELINKIKKFMQNPWEN